MSRSGAVKGIALVGLVGSVGAALVVTPAGSGALDAVAAANTSAVLQAGTLQTRQALSQSDRASRTAMRQTVGEETAGRPAQAAVVAPVAPTANVVLGVTGIKAVPRDEVASMTASNAGGDPDALVGARAGLDTGSFAGAGAGLGLSPNGQRVYSAVRAAFGLTNIGGYRAGDWGDHGTGHAADIMVPNFATGDAVAAFVQANAAALGVKYVIWKQAIWFPGSSGWRGMEDRGSPTQNHYDHVHVSVN